MDWVLSALALPHKGADEAWTYGQINFHFVIDFKSTWSDLSLLCLSFPGDGNKGLWSFLGTVAKFSVVGLWNSDVYFKAAFEKGVA